MKRLLVDKDYFCEKIFHINLKTCRETHQCEYSKNGIGQLIMSF